MNSPSTPLIMKELDGLRLIGEELSALLNTIESLIDLREETPLFENLVAECQVRGSNIDLFCNNIEGLLTAGDGEAKP